MRTGRLPRIDLGASPLENPRVAHLLETHRCRWTGGWLWRSRAQRRAKSWMASWRTSAMGLRSCALNTGEHGPVGRELLAVDDEAHVGTVRRLQQAAEMAHEDSFERRLWLRSHDRGRQRRSRPCPLWYPHGGTSWSSRNGRRRIFPRSWWLPLWGASSSPPSWSWTDVWNSKNRTRTCYRHSWWHADRLLALVGLGRTTYGVMDDLLAAGRLSVYL